MAYLHCWIRILIMILILTANQMYYAELFTLHGVALQIAILTAKYRYAIGIGIVICICPYK